MRESITLGSLFDGISGFPEAGRRNDIKAIWASEIEPFPLKVSTIRFPDMEQKGDIAKLNGAELEPVDIITGGSPCQDLSIAGKRAGLAGERSGLFMEQIRIIREMRENERRNGKTNEHIRPRLMVWENVPGTFSSNKGEDFRAVLEETARIADETVIIPGPAKGKWSTVGCIMGDGWSIAWRVLDAQYWGVPQRRRRIFLVADFGGQSAPEILFKRKGLRRHLAESREARERTAADAERGIGKANECLTPWDVQSKRIHKTDGKWPALYSGSGGGGAHGYAAIPNKAYSIQGSVIGRADKNGPQGSGINDNVPFTLNTTDRHAIVYGICSDSSNSMKSSNPHSGIYEADTTRTLDQNGGSPACNQGGMAVVQAAGFNGFKSVSGSIQYQEDKAATLEANMPGNVMATLNGPDGKNISHALCSKSFGRLDPTCETFVAGCDFRNDKENDDLCGTLQAKPNGGFSYNCIHPVRVGYSVRRLTPLECERLQDYPDGWTDIQWQETTKKGKVKTVKAKDSPKYKATGNSVAVCCPEYVLEGIAKILSEAN